MSRRKSSRREEEHKCVGRKEEREGWKWEVRGRKGSMEGNTERKREK